MQAKLLLDQYFDDMVKAIQNTVAVDTTLTDAQDGAPFGLGCKQCLDLVLQMGNDMGLDTYNCDGYAGHIELAGSSHKVLGVLGHLDIVPANQADGWIHPPFGGVIDGNKLYGRGTMDDKGPMIACLYALKALKDSGYQPSKTIRLIFGCDEETGMRCVTHYFGKVSKPDIAFSPDGDFPVINIEKGIYHMTMSMGKLDADILSINSGTRANVVPNVATAVVAGKHDIDVAGVDVVYDNDTTTITTHGQNAHGSTPQEGVNATWQLMSILHDMFPQDNTVSFYANKLCDYTGKSWGIQLSDSDSGALTCNMGVVTYNGDSLDVQVDIRFPASYNCSQITDLIRSVTPYDMPEVHSKEPLYVAKDSFLVSTLLDIYDSHTGGKAQPLAIGGGTYSRCLDNCVAFGPLMPAQEQTIHMPNEYIELDRLKTMSHLYLDALYLLSK